MFNVSKRPNLSGQAHWPSRTAWALILLSVLATGPGFFTYALVHALLAELPADQTAPFPGPNSATGHRDVAPYQKAASAAGSAISEMAVGETGAIEDDPLKAYFNLRRTTEAVDTRTALNPPGRLLDSKPKTYRTVCVRLCDGYYFPISYSTTVAHFADQEQLCQSRCDSSARLYAYPNPGGTPAQMNDLSGNPYLSLQTAFRFHVAFDATCSCRPQPWTIAAKQRHRLYAKAEQNTRQIATGSLQKTNTLGSPRRVASVRRKSTGRANEPVTPLASSPIETSAPVEEKTLPHGLAAKYERAKIVAGLMTDLDVAALTLSIPPSQTTTVRRKRSANSQWRRRRFRKRKPQRTAFEILRSNLDPTKF